MSELDRLIDRVEAGTATTMLFEDALGAATPQADGWAELAYHGSLDAAKELHEKLLPGWMVQELSQNSRSMGWNMLLVRLDDGHYISSHEGGKTGFIHSAARAWLLAILKTYRDSNQAEGAR